MVFPLVAVTLDTDILILGVQNLSIDSPGGPVYHLGDHFGGLGTPWGTVGAVGKTRARSEPDF